MNREPRRRVMIVGIDGGTLDLILPWAEAGLLPAFSRLMAEGSWGTLASVVPPVSPTAWSSLVTGTNPGEHGVYDFVSRRPGTYETALASAARRTGSPLWQLLSRAGQRVVVFNVPLTYPVEPVNGLFVSGMMTPAGANDASWPPALLADIRRHVPAFGFSPPPLLTPGEELTFVQAVTDLNQATLEVARYLVGQGPWDFYMAVFMGADIASHFLWKQMEEGRRPGYQPHSAAQAQVAVALRDCYRQLDASLGELWTAAGPDVHLFVVSDHGFGRLDSTFHVNTWLLERGYLKLARRPATLGRRLMFRAGVTRLGLGGVARRLGMAKRVRRARRYEQLRQMGIDLGPEQAQQDGAAPQPTQPGGQFSGGRRQRDLIRTWLARGFLSLADVDWSRSQLFSLGFTGPIYVNLKGREPQGIVSPGAEYEQLLDRVTSELRAVREPRTGRPIVGEVYGRDLYHGAHAAEAPDLTILPADWAVSTVGLIDFGANRWLTPSPILNGMHRPEGILFLAGPGIRQNLALSASSILDVAPTVMALLGQPVPKRMDGRVLEQAMTDELRRSLNIRQGAEEDAAGTARALLPYDADEEAELREHLRGLGYVA